MKTIITSSGANVNSEFDVRFGRAAWFCVLDESNGAIEFIQNKFKDENNGAGTKVSEFMIELGIEKVISGDFGPKAKALLDKFNVQMVIVNDTTLTIDQMIKNMQ